MSNRFKFDLKYILIIISLLLGILLKASRVFGADLTSNYDLINPPSGLSSLAQGYIRNNPFSDYALIQTGTYDYYFILGKIKKDGSRFEDATIIHYYRDNNNYNYYYTLNRNQTGTLSLNGLYWCNFNSNMPRLPNEGGYESKIIISLLIFNIVLACFNAWSKSTRKG